MQGIAILPKFMNQTAAFAVRTGDAHDATTTLKTRRIGILKPVDLRVIEPASIAVRTQ
jgi:hypothetical protein